MLHTPFLVQRVSRSKAVIGNYSNGPTQRSTKGLSGNICSTFRHVILRKNPMTLRNLLLNASPGAAAERNPAMAKEWKIARNIGLRSPPPLQSRRSTKTQLHGRIPCLFLLLFLKHRPPVGPSHFRRCSRDTYRESYITKYTCS